MAGSKNPKKVIAVDLGGTNMRVAVVKSGKILKYSKKPTPKNSKQLIAQLIEMIDEVFSKEIRGIGVGSPGPLKDGIIKNPPNLSLRNYNLGHVLKKRYKIPVVIGHDASCFALAEMVYGCKKKNFILLTFGTGVGGGLIIGGKLYSGSGYAGELGHIILDKGKSFEQLWQEKNILIKKSYGREMYVNEVLKKKDKNSEIVLRYLSNYIGQGIGSLINCFDPEVVVLGGGVRECGEKLLKPIKLETIKYSKLPKKTPIIWTSSQDSGILGASLLVK